MLYQFHVNLYALPKGLAQGPAVTLRGISPPTLRRHDGQPPTFTAFLSVTFEEAFAALAHLPRLDAEPDGFFVLAGDHDAARWQVDGHLFDFDGRLHRVELHGACPPDMFDALLGCFGWPHTPLAFELVREGVALDEPNFRAWASRVVPDPGA
jgi:hypothetical protein